MPIAAWVVIGIVVVLLFIFIGIYNGLVRLRNQVKNAWAQIDVQLKRRHDLIPNLVETTKGYMKYERETLEAVTKARNIAVQASSAGAGERAKVEGELSSALSRLLAVVERYPDLKANQNFVDLQHQLEGTENRINVARQRYNQAVETFNAAIRTFPNSLTNSMLLHLTRKEFFKADAAAQAAPKVKF